MPTIAELQQSSLAIQSESSRLNPSSLITLYEIDLSSLAKDKNIAQSDIDDQNYKTIFRFHNLVKAFNGTSIVWSGKDGEPKTFIAAPIQVVGFEYNAKGTLPTPKLSITINEENILYLNILKQRMLEYGDLVGAKVTRIRTYFKYLDSINFGPGRNNSSADWTKEFPRDVFYIDRKTSESKFAVEFELASILDVEGLMLPGRLCLSRCPFQYRGEGCCFERQDRKTFVHGDAQLPQVADPIATANDEFILEILKAERLNDQGQYVLGKTYYKADYIYIQKDGVKYYYVSKIDRNHHRPPNLEFWIEDCCSKSVTGCKLRWQAYSWDNLLHKVIPRRGTIPVNVLPYGGFPSVSKYGFNLY